MLDYKSLYQLIEALLPRNANPCRILSKNAQFPFAHFVFRILCSLIQLDLLYVSRMRSSNMLQLLHEMLVAVDIEEAIVPWSLPHPNPMQKTAFSSSGRAFRRTSCNWNFRGEPFLPFKHEGHLGRFPIRNP